MDRLIIGEWKAGRCPVLHAITNRIDQQNSAEGPVIARVALKLGGDVSTDAIYPGNAHVAMINIIYEMLWYHLRWQRDILPLGRTAILLAQRFHVGSRETHIEE